MEARQSEEAEARQCEEAEETQCGVAEATQTGEEQGGKTADLLSSLLSVPELTSSRKRDFARKSRNPPRKPKNSIPNFIDAFCAEVLSDDDFDDSVVDKDFEPGPEKTFVEDDEFNYSPVHPATLDLIRETEEEANSPGEEEATQTVEKGRGVAPVGRGTSPAPGKTAAPATLANVYYDPHPSLVRIGEGVYEVPGRTMPLFVKPHMNICTGKNHVIGVFACNIFLVLHCYKFAISDI